MYRECGVYRSSYAEDMVLFPLPADRIGDLVGVDETSQQRRDAPVVPRRQRDTHNQASQ